MKVKKSLATARDFSLFALVLLWAISIALPLRAQEAAKVHKQKSEVTQQPKVTQDGDVTQSTQSTDVTQTSDSTQKTEVTQSTQSTDATQSTGKSATAQQSKITQSPDDTQIGDNTFLPAASKEKSNDAVILKYRDYTIGYSPSLKLPLWVAYYISEAEVKAPGTKRVDLWGIVDQAHADLPEAHDNDYRNSGYDRGHMANVDDLNFDPEGVKESYYFFNVTPQPPNFNRNTWLSLEKATRKWAAHLGGVYLVSGIVPSSIEGTIGEDKIPIPHLYYKILYAPKEKTMIAFLLSTEEQTLKDNIFKVETSVDKIEELTGLDFFSELPDAEEEGLESKLADTSLWK